MLGGASLVYFCFGLTVAAMAPLVNPVARELGLSHSAMGSVLGAWQLVYIVSAIPCGALLDRVGPRRALFLAVVIIGTSGVLRSLSEGHMSLFLAVAVFGLGGPLVSIGGPKLISLWFEGKERGLAMGIFVTGQALGSVAGLAATNGLAMPLAGGSWRVVLLAYAGIALASGLVWLAVSTGGARRVTDAGRAVDSGRSSLGVFRDLLRIGTVRIVLLMGICIFFYNHGLGHWLPEILRSKGMDAAAAGYWASVPIAISIAGALIIPRLAIPRRRIAILATLFLFAGTATLLIQILASPALAAGLVLQGVTRGSMTIIAVLVLMETPEVESRYVGSAVGMFFAASEIGGVLGPLSVGALSDVTGDFSVSLYVLTGACGVLLALLARLGLRTR
jgi:cyanate permease